MASSLPREWTNLGPLTTVFTPDATCSTEGFYPLPTPGWLTHYDRGCLPKVSDGGYYYYHSPGFCPSGWSTAVDYATLYRGVPALAPGESIAICCPR